MKKTARAAASTTAVAPGANAVRRAIRVTRSTPRAHRASPVRPVSSAPRDPFFEQPYEAAATDAAPAWEASAKPATTSRVSANIKSKRKVAALFKTGE